MKSKILLFSMLSLFMFSCSSDDESSGTPAIPENEKLLDNMNFFNEVNIQLTYNPDKTVETINFAGQAIFMFTYTDNQINTMEVAGAVGSGIYTFTYDDNGRISTFSLDDEVTDVVWNEANRYYLYQRENLDEVTIILNQHDDIEKILYYDDLDNETKSTTHFYEESKKGTMTNSNQIATAIELIFPEQGLSVYTSSLGKKPIKTIALPYGILTFQNTYDDQGFVSASSVNIGAAEPSPVTFNYTQL